MVKRTVLFAGGPFHGQIRTIDTPRLTTVERPHLSLADGVNVYIEPQQVPYNTTRFVICGHVIWIGHLDARPSDDLVFEVLTSDNAKLASCKARPLG